MHQGAAVGTPDLGAIIASCPPRIFRKTACFVLRERASPRIQPAAYLLAARLFASSLCLMEAVRMPFRFLQNKASESLSISKHFF